MRPSGSDQSCSSGIRTSRVKKPRDNAGLTSYIRWGFRCPFMGLRWLPPFIAMLSPVVLPLIEAPVVLLLAAGPPALELPPAVLAGLCASANELVSANAVTSAIVFRLMVLSLWFTAGDKDSLRN